MPKPERVGRRVTLTMTIVDRVGFERHTESGAFALSQRPEHRAECSLAAVPLDSGEPVGVGRREERLHVFPRRPLACVRARA